MTQKMTLMLAALTLTACHSSPSSSGVDSQLAQVQQMVFAESNHRGGGNADFVCVGRLNDQSGSFLAASLVGNHGQDLQLKVERVHVTGSNQLERKPLQDDLVHEVRGANYVSYFSGHFSEHLSGQQSPASSVGRGDSSERHQRIQERGRRHEIPSEHVHGDSEAGRSVAEYDETNRELRLHLNEGRSRNTVIRCDTGEVLSMN